MLLIDEFSFSLMNLLFETMLRSSSLDYYMKTVLARWKIPNNISAYKLYDAHILKVFRADGHFGSNVLKSIKHQFPRFIFSPFHFLSDKWEASSQNFLSILYLYRSLRGNITSLTYCMSNMEIVVPIKWVIFA